MTNVLAGLHFEANLTQQLLACLADFFLLLKGRDSSR